MQDAKGCAGLSAPARRSQTRPRLCKRDKEFGREDFAATLENGRCGACSLAVSVDAFRRLYSM
jgi:hypothetical protein